ncbi:MAG: SusC/RagA family TonB-linked outer membrane protein, partial [Candidatus Cryptobacteroides sp.]
MNKLITIMVAILLPVLLWGQAGRVTVSGTVSDDAGPLPGATVYEDGNMSNGTVTDADGKYVLTLKQDGTIVISCLGYADVREKVSGRKKVDVRMKESTETLAASEVVSVGYGSIARRDLTGSVSKVNMDELAKSTPMNFDQALAGRVAGVVVTTSDGSVGAEANIVIRGNNSLTQSSAPLYVIDGFPMESSFATSISPSDIESIDVLKDASASAIYGARGANGVIIITTKKGSVGKPTINFSASWTGSTLANKVDLLNGMEYVRLDDEFNMFQTNTHSNYFTRYMEDGFVDTDYYSLEDYAAAPSVDWQDYVYRNAFSQNYSLSIGGGSSKSGTTYNVSLSAMDQNGILIASNFNRYSASIKLKQEIGKKVSVDVSASYSQATTNGSQPASSESGSTVSSYLLYQVWGFRPTRPLRFGPVGDAFINQLVDEEVSDPDSFRFNPMANVKNSYRRVRRNYLNGNIAFNWDIVKGLRLRISAGYNNSRTRDEAFNGSQTMSGHPASPLGQGPNGRIYNTDLTGWLNENTLTWDSTFGLDHNLQILGGFTIQGEQTRFTGVAANHIQSESLGIEGINTGQYQSVTPYKREWLLISGLARLNYNYAHKYYVTASVRADGSSKFAKGNRWGIFPSASLAWTFSNENWAQNSGWFNNGKLRVSWGMTGNNRTQTPYDFYARFVTTPGANSLDYVRDGQTVSGYYRENMENPYLGWETTAQTNIGLDLSFLKDRISLTADFYQKDTYDLLLQATMPASSGYESAMVNVGSIRNRGVELSLNVVPVKVKNFEWTSTLNFGMNKNVVTALANNQTTPIS